ncbi:MAG TPA: radical SAM protein, partial [Candidatus Kryptobacter bacterium]|nr:radical SAM protein [Candidatus Kryptobacter bacterium]
MKRVLLTTIHRPLGVENETCTKNIQAEMYHAQVTLAQGPFSIKSVCTGWGLEFIAANLDAPTTVLHYPTIRRFIRELRKGYDYVGIGFVICTFPKTRELCEIIRRESPGT